MLQNSANTLNSLFVAIFEDKVVIIPRVPANLTKSDSFE